MQNEEIYFDFSRTMEKANRRSHIVNICLIALIPVCILGQLAILYLSPYKAPTTEIQSKQNINGTQEMYQKIK